MVILLNSTIQTEKTHNLVEFTKSMPKELSDGLDVVQFPLELPREDKMHVGNGDEKGGSGSLIESKIFFVQYPDALV